MNRQFTQGEKSATSPAFSPDGNYLTFLSSRNGENQIYKMPLDGGEAQKITSAENGVSRYKLSPDGSHIAYTMTDPKSEEEKTREREKRDVILMDQDFKFARLYVQPADGDSAIAIYGEDLHTTGFDWSPDGTQIVFSHQPTPRINDRYYNDISLVPSDSGAVKELVNRTGVDSNPFFTPDGERIVFSSHGGELEVVGLGDLFMISANGGEPEALPYTYDRNASIVGFDSDGNLLITESRHTASALYRVPLNGAEPELLIENDGIYNGFDVNQEGDRVVFTYQNSDEPGEVFYSDLNNFSRQKVSAVFDDADFPEMGKTEVITWNSPDGTEVEGLLTYPVGYEEGDQVPLILMVHGGPAGVYSQTWTGSGGIYAVQFFAD